MHGGCPFGTLTYIWSCTCTMCSIRITCLGALTGKRASVSFRTLFNFTKNEKESRGLDVTV